VKAAVIEALGHVPVYADFPEPEPRDEAVVATVEAAALTNLTRGLVAGTHYGSSGLTLPGVAGLDGVARLADGRRVYGFAVSPYGMMAERTLIAPARSVELPDGIDPVLAAAAPNPGVSAWVSLQHAAQIGRSSTCWCWGPPASPVHWRFSSPKPSSEQGGWWPSGATPTGSTGCAVPVPTR